MFGLVLKIPVIDSGITVSIDVTPGATDYEYDFSAVIVGGVAPYTYVWNFGDGSGTSTSATPTYTYAIPDADSIYSVSLTVTDAEGLTGVCYATVSVMGWLLLDGFTTLEASPMVSPRTCDGKGTLTLIPNSGTMAVTVNGLETSGDAMGFYSNVLPRAVGIGFFGTRRFTVLSGVSYLGAFQNQSLSNSGGANVEASTTTISANLGFTSAGKYHSISVTQYSAGVHYSEAVIMSSTGGYLFTKTSGEEWVLRWRFLLGSDATIYAAMSNSSTVQSELSFLGVRQLPAPFNTDYGIATLNTTAANGVQLTGTADQILDLTITAPAVLADSAGIRHRVLDDDNYHWAGFDSAGAFRAYKVVAGVLIEYSSAVNVAGVITGGASRTIRVIERGQTLDFYTLSGSTWTKRGNPNTDSFNQSQSAVEPEAVGDWVLGALQSYPVTNVSYSELERGL